MRTEADQDTARAAIQSPYRKVLRDDEISRLRQATHPLRDRVAFELGYSCGLRSQEIAGLRWGDIDLDRNVLFVGSHIAKGGRARAVHLSDGMRDLLVIYQETVGFLDHNAPLFRSREGGGPLTPDRIRRVVVGSFKRAGIYRAGLSSHSLRHTCASVVYRATKDLELTRRMLGHSSIMTTQVYLQGLGELVGFSETVEAALSALNAGMTGADDAEA